MNINTGVWQKSFDNWNEKKKAINSVIKGDDFYFKEREIWWSSLGVNIGYEQDGKNDNFERPILILKIFNRDVLWMVPLTSTSKDHPYYYKFNDSKTDRSVILSQLRLISSKRLLRKISMMNKVDFNNIREKIKQFIA